MSKTPEELQAFAEQFYQDICKSKKAPQVLIEIRKEDEFFESVDTLSFNEEFHLGLLALACVYWERLCHLHQIHDEKSQKSMLVVVMAGFESPESIEQAKSFSEYFCGDEKSGDLQPVPAVAKKLFERLNRECAVNDAAGVPQITAGFKKLVEIYEGFRVYLETEFEAFVDSIDE